MKVLFITIDLKVLPLPIRNEIITTVKNSKNHFLLENQEIKIDNDTLNMIVPILEKFKN